MPSIIDFAFNAVDAGLAVFPIVEAGKTPAYRGGGDATRSRQRVPNHWQQHPNNNYGIAARTPPGVLVIDMLDRRSYVTAEGIDALISRSRRLSSRAK